jgi:catechol 2,3-dioxygenase-like lactoylglutathione lyase family enzyme
MTSPTAQVREREAAPGRTSSHPVRGINHMAFPTFNPAATIGFYRDVLGLPLVQTMQVSAWGPEYQRDFVHFFFDIGNADCLAFFYYFGQEPYRDENLPPLLDLGTHVALHVDTLEDLNGFQQRIEDAGLKLEMRVMHETVESIYVRDPNDILIEIARPLRELTAADAVDAQVTTQALLDVLASDGEPTLEALWARKAELIASGAPGPARRTMTTLYFLDAAEFTDVAAAAAAQPGAQVERLPGYVTVTSDGPLIVDRRATGVRHAVWYSALAAVGHGRVVQYDKDALNVEPAP